MNQTKSQIIKVLVEQTGLPKKQVEAVLNEYLLTIREIVLKGESFNWRNFGTFLLKERKPRKVRDFTTGESRVVILSPVPAFRPSKSLLDAVAPNKKKIKTDFSKDTDDGFIEGKEIKPNKSSSTGIKTGLDVKKKTGKSTYKQLSSSHRD